MRFSLPLITKFRQNFTNSKTLQNIHWGPLLIVIASILWSLDGILRANLREIPPASLVMIEHLLGLIVLIPFWGRFWRQFRQVSNNARISLVVTGVVSSALGTIFYTTAVQQAFANGVAFSTIVLLQQLQPFVAVTLASLVLKEKISARYIIPAVFAIIGVYLINFPGLVPDLGSEASRAQIAVGLFAVAAAVAWGSGTVFSKAALKEFDFVAATTGRFFVAAIAAGLLIVIPGQFIPFTAINSAQWLQFVIIVFTAGLVALLFYYKGLKSTEAKVSTIAELTWPASALIIDIARGVDFTNTQLIGLIITIIMIYRVSQLQQEKADPDIK